MYKVKKLFIYFQREGKGPRKRGRETWMLERNINQLPLICPLSGTRPATQACALTRNQTGDLFLYKQTSHPLTHTSQGNFFIYFGYQFIRWMVFKCFLIFCRLSVQPVSFAVQNLFSLMQSHLSVLLLLFAVLVSYLINGFV